MERSFLDRDERAAATQGASGGRALPAFGQKDRGGELPFVRAVHRGSGTPTRRPRCPAGDDHRLRYRPVVRRSSGAHSRTVHGLFRHARAAAQRLSRDRKSTRLNSSHGYISYAVFCLKKKKKKKT